MHSAPYFTAFGLLTILHASRVVRLRTQLRISMGSAGNAEMERMIRVFGNFSEYAPIGLILLIGLEFVQAPVWYVHVCGMTLLLGRIAHALGLARAIQPDRYRIVGMVLTFISLFLSSVGVTLWNIFEPVVR